MADKRQSTTGAWVSPVAIESTQQHSQREPSVKGEISSWRVTVFFALAVIVALALGYLAFVAWGVYVALAVAVLVVLLVFVPLFGFDTLASTGYLHRRLEAIVELDKIALATKQATAINKEQQEQLEQLWEAIAHIDERLKLLETVDIHDKTGTRSVPKYDDVDAAIGRWLASLFDPNGQMVGAHRSGALKEKYPFKGDGDMEKQAHYRLVRAGLVGQNATSKQYTWVGPATLSETRKRL